ncbi:hypothetical protein Sez_1500 [Streptococcus equi subsp. zooepidemicus MGCS10565]|uniref:Uncharacterized protein n=1 Tax=Streptococcus equi subsp. zooepidemicus (strain MGCS10565) TaxID=552526 RepID=B4U4B6_STREM|nr:hypothetical protein Sez_1500 [Streptococcus equi subsp. zooepidemicus MGCS10565]
MQGGKNWGQPQFFLAQAGIQELTDKASLRKKPEPACKAVGLPKPLLTRFYQP